MSYIITDAGLPSQPDIVATVLGLAFNYEKQPYQVWRTHICICFVLIQKLHWHLAGFHVTWIKKGHTSAQNIT